jgi:hypothetical protein
MGKILLDKNEKTDTDRDRQIGEQRFLFGLFGPVYRLSPRSRRLTLIVDCLLWAAVLPTSLYIYFCGDDMGVLP